MRNATAVRRQQAGGICHSVTSVSLGREDFGKRRRCILKLGMAGPTKSQTNGIQGGGGGGLVLDPGVRGKPKLPYSVPTTRSVAP